MLVCLDAQQRGELRLAVLVAQGKGGELARGRQAGLALGFPKIGLGCGACTFSSRSLHLRLSGRVLRSGLCYDCSRPVVKGSGFGGIGSGGIGLGCAGIVIGQCTRRLSSRSQAGIPIARQARQVSSEQGRCGKDNGGYQSDAGKYQALAQLAGRASLFFDLDGLLLQGELFQLALVSCLAGA